MAERQSEETPKAPESREGALHLRLARLWDMVKTYPLPFLSLTVLVVSLILWLLGHGDWTPWTLGAIIVVGGVPLLWQTIMQLVHREMSVDLIAILAIAGALALQQYLAGAFIVLMMSGGEALEAFALRRASSSLSALAERAPRTARIWRDGDMVTVPADQIEVGMEVVVPAGEVIPVDGVVVSGASSVSEADLTGEPTPVRKEPGSLVLSGSVNLERVLQARATKRSAESQYAQIVRLVEEAQKQKAPIHRLADRYAVWFTLFALTLTALTWALTRDSLYALAVLVVATPCPLILATPIAIMSGIDRAARLGLIVKSGGAIEQLGEVDVAVFDKTGTLTLGMPRLVDIVLAEDVPDASHPDAQESSPPTDSLAPAAPAPTTSAPSQEPAYAQTPTKVRLLALAASVEQFSAHILARAVVEAAQAQHTPLTQAEAVDEIGGKGVSGLVSLPEKTTEPERHERPIKVAVGNRTFMRALEIPLPQALLDERQRRTAEGEMGSFLALDGQVVGLLVFADVPRPEISRLTAELKAAGIQQTILLTGDGETVARQIGALAKMDRVVAQCLPADKVALLTELQRQGRHPLMVGDGVNDAPALALATVGIAMGANGVTAAASAADSVLLSPDLLQIARAVRLGRRTVQIAREGIWIGIGLSVVAMFFAAFGFIPPTAGAILQEGIDALVILNALRVGMTH
ncbi:MAG TPA: HAD-IC family P-type ATPase [Ktedonobacterales bacterium]|nr:HAD-IC family P-type ATPase [Ktedonobacterales bacterium]